jgi:hypothetical protein
VEHRLAGISVPTSRRATYSFVCPSTTGDGPFQKPLEELFMESRLTFLLSIFALIIAAAPAAVAAEEGEAEKNAGLCRFDPAHRRVR